MRSLNLALVSAAMMVAACAPCDYECLTEVRVALEEPTGMALEGEWIVNLSIPGGDASSCTFARTAAGFEVPGGACDGSEIAVFYDPDRQNMVFQLLTAPEEFTVTVTVEGSDVGSANFMPEYTTPQNDPRCPVHDCRLADDESIALSL